ncbi:MAG: DUF368 domain-containing protein, partial [Clostridiales bacterium]|nr:DUF368 domain-containing protein [Clostridiales bacterium]
MKWFLDVLRGMVIGLANVIPGVSGGTMMVSMGIYDKLIWSINHLLKEFKKSITILLPYLVGMVAAILLGAVGLKVAFARFPLPTNALFIGLILGSLPFILKEMKGEQIGWQGILVFVLFFALVVGLKIVEGENSTEIRLSVLEIFKLFLLGTVASATMVIPGVSGSMILKTLGYYEPIVTGAIPSLLKGVTGGDWGLVGHNIGILLPFGLGIVFGIFAIAKLIAFLMKKWKGRTYCAILGMVAASPVVILMDTSIYEGFSVWICVASVAALALGIFCAMKLGGEPETVK